MQTRFRVKGHAAGSGHFTQRTCKSGLTHSKYKHVGPNLVSLVHLKAAIRLAVCLMSVMKLHRMFGVQSDHSFKGL